MKSLVVIFIYFICFVVKYAATYTDVCETLVPASENKILEYEYTGNKTGQICVWEVYTGKSGAFNLTFTDLELRNDSHCQYDHLDIYDGSMGQENNKIGTCCGPNMCTYLSATSRVYVAFYSSGGQVKRFKLQYRQLRPCKVSISFKVVDDKFVLSCSSDCPTPVSYIWSVYKNGENRIFYVPNGQSDITNRLEKSNFGSYTCIAIHYATADSFEYSGSKEISISVYYGPSSNMIMTSTVETYLEGQSARLDCHADCYPLCSYSWTFRGKTLKSDDSVNSSSLFFDHLTRSQTGEYTCIASNPKSLHSWSKNISMVVFYGPDNSTVVSKSLTPVIAGETIQLECSADCQPACAFTWSSGGSVIQANTSTGSLVINNATRLDEGQYTCTAINYAMQNNGSRSVYVEVNYEPIIENFQINNQSLSVYVNEHDKVDVICNVDSKPASTIELRNDTNQIKLVHNSTRIQFAWKEASCEDSNSYFCTADNSVNERVKKQIELFVNCEPRLNYHKNSVSSFSTQLGKDVILHISVIAFPPPVFTWYKLVNGQKKLLKQTEPVNTNSWSSVGQLILYKTKREDAGDYQVVVTSEKFDTKLVKRLNLVLTELPVIDNFQINNQSQSAKVNEHDKVDVICSVDSKPASTIELRNDTNQIKVVHNSTRIQFAWKEASCEDSNIYFCTADNSVNERVKKQIELFVNCHPRVNYHESFMSSFTSQLGNDAVLHISVIAFPPPVFTWSKLVNGQWKLLKQTEPDKTNLWSCVGQLILYKTKREDAGDYQVVVSSEKFDSKLVKRLKLVLTDSTQDMKMIYVGAAAGGAVLLVVVLIILVFVLIRKRRASSKKRNRETGNLPAGVSDDDSQRERQTGNDNVSADPDADYDCLEMETVNRNHSRDTLGDNYFVPCTPFDNEKSVKAKANKNTMDDTYLVPCYEEYYESCTDNEELRDSYSKLAAVRSEQNPYDRMRRVESPSCYDTGVPRPRIINYN